MSVAAEEQKRHKDSRQQDPRKEGKEGAIRESVESIWSKRSCSSAMVFPEQSKPRHCSVLRLE